MKFEKLKEKILDEVAAKPNSEAVKDFKKLAEGMGTNVQGYLRTFDVRAVGSLRERFRHLFPSYLAKCDLYLNQDSKGNWTIDRELK